MQSIKISISGNIAKVTARPMRITAGTVGLPVEFEFSEEWADLEKTAVFEAGCISRIAENIDTETTVHPDVLSKANEMLSIGVYGTNKDGTIAIPTTWADVCVIDHGVDIDGSAGSEPMLPVWKQILNRSDKAVAASDRARIEAENANSTSNEANEKATEATSVANDALNKAKDAISESSTALEKALAVEETASNGGFNGEKGDKGDKGEKGDKGDKGDPGPKGDPYGYNPLVRFDLTRNMLDVEADMVLPDDTPWKFTRQPQVMENAYGLFTTLEQVHSLFDSLVEQYQHLWTKTDAAEYVDMEYPEYARGVSSETNLFDRDRVFERCKYGEDGKTALPNDQVYIIKTAMVDLFTEEYGQYHRLAEKNLSKILWLTEGTYTLSYKVIGGEGVLRVYGVLLNEYDENGTYKLDQLTKQTVDNTDKKPGGNRLYHEFTIPEGGGYVTLIRTSQTSTLIEKIQIEKIKKNEDGTETVSDYAPYGKIAYKYRLEDGVCKKFLSADEVGDNLITWFYEPTPAYTTNLYKFSFENKTLSNGTTAAGKPAANAKRKFLLVSALHGDENVSPFNCYLFAKRLCELCEEDDYYRFAQAFDVYFMPCVNGYGMYHNTRANANGVDINRNFDSGHWAPPSTTNPGVKPTPTRTSTYPGPKASSEFETQLLQKVVEKIAPDMVCDHHTYPNGELQFYSGVARREWAPLMYQSCTDCSIAFKRKYPEYFGEQIELVVGADRDHFTYGDKVNGQFPTWLRLKSDVYFPVAIEVCRCINYRNGEYVNTKNEDGTNKYPEDAGGIDTFGEDTFSVAEYTLRNQLMRYGQFVMENKA